MTEIIKITFSQGKFFIAEIKKFSQWVVYKIDGAKLLARYLCTEPD